MTTIACKLTAILLCALGEVSVVSAVLAPPRFALIGNGCCRYINSSVEATELPYYDVSLDFCTEACERNTLCTAIEFSALNAMCSIHLVNTPDIVNDNLACDCYLLVGSSTSTTMSTTSTQTQTSSTQTETTTTTTSSITATTITTTTLTRTSTSTSSVTSTTMSSSTETSATTSTTTTSATTVSTTTMSTTSMSSTTTWLCLDYTLPDGTIWMDSSAATCETYVVQGYCNYGHNENGGYTAQTACCGCGGGDRKTSSTVSSTSSTTATQTTTTATKTTSTLSTTTSSRTETTSSTISSTSSTTATQTTTTATKTTSTLSTTTSTLTETTLVTAVRCNGQLDDPLCAEHKEAGNCGITKIDLACPGTCGACSTSTTSRTHTSETTTVQTQAPTTSSPTPETGIPTPVPVISTTATLTTSSNTVTTTSTTTGSLTPELCDGIPDPAGCLTRICVGDVLVLCPINCNSCPTDAPSAVPTDSPTDLPTDIPTNIPTDLPTDTPTDYPTDYPTNLPTESPTDLPTGIPTDFPTDVPTDLPTNAPIDLPTEFPTDLPTDAPTDVPTDVPTDLPTYAPTDLPTESPTDLPTSAPTDFPTDVPTDLPTGFPTETPTCDSEPELSCKNRCDICGTSVESNDEYACFCDSRCTELGDCCCDFEAECTVNGITCPPTPTDTLPNPRENLEGGKTCPNRQTPCVETVSMQEICPDEILKMTEPKCQTCACHNGQTLCIPTCA